MKTSFAWRATPWSRARISAAICLLLIQWPCSSMAGATDPSRTRLVVVLYPEAYNGNPGHALADHGIRSAFAHDSPDRVEIHSEYLEVSQFPDAAYQQELAAFLRRKYAGRKVDLLMAGLSSALDFAIENRAKIFPNVPIVFFAIDHEEVKKRALEPDVIGAPIKMDLADSLGLALRLHPQTEQVFVIVGKSKFDAYWEAEARKVFRAHQVKIKLTYLSGLPLADLLKRVESLPERSIAYYLHVFEDGDGLVHTPADVLGQLSNVANVPFYSHVDSYIGRGIVGGRVFSFETAGRRAAQIGMRVLAGESPQSIGIQPTIENEFLFDGRQLKRWGISQASLPSGSIVRYTEPSVWDLYKWHITTFVSLCILQTLLIASMVIQRRRRARAERRFRQAVNAAPTGMLMVGRDGIIVLANAQLERLFGYQNEELVGQPVEMLVPARYRPGHPDLFRGFFAAPEARHIGAGRELFGCRKDGSEFPIEIALNPLQTETGLFVLASLIDITEQRRAETELRDSQKELQELTSKLLVAQELERGRIARELHDDFGQELALLSVEIELLRRTPPDSNGQFVPRVDKLSARVKELSSSIHDLSHQLHPMKLEQLGLVAAVGGLCKELTQSHSVNIAFIHEHIPEQNRHEAALCLYRIAQEALRNVIKHSGAKHCAVELRGASDAISLRIHDDGKGFDPSSVAGRGGLGLVSMRERLRAVQGEITIDASPGHCTEIQVRIPLPAKSHS